MLDRRDACRREFVDRREKVEMTDTLGRILLDMGIINVDCGHMSKEEEIQGQQTDKGTDLVLV